MAIDLKLMTKIFKNRIIITYISISLIFLIALILFISNYFEKKNFEFYIKTLRNEINTIYSVVEWKEYSQILLRKIAFNVFNETGIRLTFIDYNGQVLADSEIPIEKITNVENHINKPEVRQAIKYGEGFSVRFSSTVKKELIYFASLKEWEGRKIIIRASVALKEFRDEIKNIKKDVVLFFIFVYVIALISGIIIIKKVLNPVDKIIFASKQYAARNFSYQINIDFTGEMKKLAETMNEMSKSIEKNIRELEYKNAILSNIFEGMEEGIAILSKEGKVVNYNKRFEIFFGLSGDLKNRFVNEIIRDSEFLKIIFDFEKFAFKKTDIKLLSDKFISVFAFPVKYGDKEDRAFVIYDVDKEKRLEIIKKDFIANFSHEIKTPLSVIKANIETILSSKLSTDEIAIFLKAMEKNVIRMENILKDIIKLSYLENYAKPQISEVNLRKLVEDVLRFFELAISKKNIKVLVELHQINILADRELLEDVFFNLIDNSIKYNMENGFVRIFSSKDKNEIKVIIENSGPEIPQKYLDRIFERFFTVDRSRSRELGGTGLGLSIVKHIMEIHKGYVKAESANGINRFILSFPV